MVAALARQLEAWAPKKGLSPAAGIRKDSTGPGADHAGTVASIARTIELAAQQGEWGVVASLTRQLERLSPQQGLRVIKGGTVRVTLDAGRAERAKPKSP